MQANELRAPDAREVLERLHKDVEYTHIKMIFFDLPSSISTLLWNTPAADDALLSAFASKTVRAIERHVQRGEQALATADSEAAATERARLNMIRHELVL